MTEGGHRPGRSLAAGIVVAVAVAALLAAGGAAGAASTTVSVGDGVTTTDGVAELPVTLSGAPEGLAGYRVRVQLPDETTARFRDGGVDEAFGFEATSVTDTAVALEAADTAAAVEPDDGLVRLANLTVAGVAPGTVPVRVTVTAMDADDGDRVAPAVRNGSVTVRRPVAVAVPETVTVGRVDRSAPADGRTARVVVRNPGTEPLSVTPTAVGDGLTVARPAAETFTVPGGGARAVAVTVTPGSDGRIAEPLRLSTTAGDRTVTVTGTAVSPTLSLPTTAVALGTASLGSTADGEIRVRNTGEAPLSVTATGDAGFPAGAELTVPAGGERALPVRVDVTEETVTASVRLRTDDPDRPTRTVGLSATGVAGSLSATRPTFPPTARGETATATVTVENDGDAAVPVSATATGAAFTVADAPATVPAGGNATVTVQFRPTTAGEATGSLRLGPEGRFRVSLTGRGVGPSAAVADRAFDAGVVRATGTATVTVPVTNTGPPGTSLTVDAATVDGPFTVTDAPATVPAGETRPVVVRFRPATATRSTGRLRVRTDAGDVTRTVTGTGARPDASVRPDGVDFGAVDTGTRSVRSVEVTNTGGLPLNVTGVTATGGAFTVVSEPPTRLVAGESTTVRVAAAPSAAGEATGRLAVTFTDASRATADLAVAGVTPAATLATDGPVSFGDVPAGSGATRTVVVDNTGGATLRLGPATTTGPFRPADDTPRLVAPGETATYTVVYTPEATAAGESADGTLRLPATNDPDRAALTVDLTGTATAGEAAVRPAALSLGGLPVGETATGTVTVESLGGGTVDVQGVRVAGPDAARVSVDGPATPTLAPGETATYAVSVDAATRGPVTARVVVETADGPVTATVGAVGTAPTAALSATTVTVAPTRLGERRTERLRVSNGGNAPLNVTGVTTAGTAFTVVDAPATVPPGETRPVVVSYASPATDAAVAAATDGDPRVDTARLTVETNATDRTARLTGEAVTPDVRVDSRAVQFGTTRPGGTATRRVTVRNDADATAAVTLTGTALSGDTEAFRVGAFAGETLAPGESVTRTVEFRPAARGSRFASLSVRNDDTRQGANVVTLSSLETTVAVRFGSVTVEYRDPVPGRQPAVDVSRGLDRSVSLSRLRVGAGTDEDFSVRLETSETAFDTRLARPGDTPLRYFDVTAAPAVDNATLTVTVSKAALAAAGSPPETVRLLAADGDGYEPVDTTRVGETRTGYRYRATLRDLDAAFVVAGGVPATSVTDVSVPARATAGETVRVRVRVANDGRATGDRTVRVWTDGEVVERTVSVPAGGATTASLPVSYGDPGRYRVAVDGRDDGPTVTVYTPPSTGGSVAPTAALSAPPTAAVGQSVTLDAGASTDDDEVVTYRWDTDGDGVTETQTSDPTLARTFERSGRQTVSVTVVDRDGETDTASVTVSVAPRATATATTAEPTRTAVTPETQPTATATETSAPPSATPRPTTAPTATPTATASPTPTPAVTASPTATPRATTRATTTGTRTPGFGAALALLALLALAGLAGRRR